MTPALLGMREALNEVEAERDRLWQGRKDSLDAQVRYDMASVRWARMSNAYDDMIRAAIAEGTGA